MRSSKQQVECNPSINKKRKHLNIVIPQQQPQQKAPNTSIKKPSEYLKVFSARNIKSKAYDYPEQNSQKKQETVETIQKLQVLEHEKQCLISALQNLKEGAVNALIEKQNEIDELKIKINEVKQREIEQSESSNEAEILEKQLARVTAQVELLKNELEELKQKYLKELQERNQIILDISAELEKNKLKAEELNFQDRLLAEKVKRAEEENQTLNQQLFNFKINLSKLQESVSNSVNRSCTVNQMESMKSQMLKRYRFQELKTEYNNNSRKLSFQLSESEDQIERIREMNEREMQRHRQQIMEIQRFYEDKLQATKLRYQNQLKNIKIYKQNSVREPEISETQQKTQTRFNTQYHDRYDDNRPKIDYEIRSIRSNKSNVQILKSRVALNNIQNQPSLFSARPLKEQSLFNIKQYQQLDRICTDESPTKVTQPSNYIHQNQQGWLKRKQVVVLISTMVFSGMLLVVSRLRK